MALSRLRLRLAAWFALAFIAGLLMLSLGLFAYTRHQSDRHMTRGLELAAGQLLGAVRLEYAEAPGRGLQVAVASALEEWVPRPEAFGIYDGRGSRIAVTGATELTRALPPELSQAPSLPTDVPGPGEHPIRLAAASAVAPNLSVVVAGSTERLDEDAEGLALWLVVSTPLTALLSLVAGYGLSRYALRPVQRLEQAIGAVAPDALARRLPVHDRPDELDRVAQQFNTLLERLEQSQERNRRFIEQAAHQIRTPLTLVLGETELALEGVRSSEAQTDALRRVRLAAGQMRRRVDELMLLARAAAGERVPLVDVVELDGLALECADLMRSRAQALGRRLELARMDPVTVQGSEALLREAVIELLENACRHGSANGVVQLAVFAEGASAVVEVVNAATDPTARLEDADGAAVALSPREGQGLGLHVVRWIAAEHGGQLRQRRESSRFVSRLLVPGGSSAEHSPGDPSQPPDALIARGGA